MNTEDDLFKEPHGFNLNKINYKNAALELSILLIN